MTWRTSTIRSRKPKPLALKSWSPDTSPEREKQRLFSSRVGTSRRFIRLQRSRALLEPGSDAMRILALLAVLVLAGALQAYAQAVATPGTPRRNRTYYLLR